MTEPVPFPFHQLGRFIFLFQHLEAALTELLVLMTRADDEAIRILVNELEFNKRIRTVDVLFARFIEIMSQTDKSKVQWFHELMGEVQKLSVRRNELVHSKYTLWVSADGTPGLIRENSKLRASKGIREQEEEEILAHILDTDCDSLTIVLQKLEALRLEIIKIAHP